jgi:hypothetical protein
MLHFLLRYHPWMRNLRYKFTTIKPVKAMGGQVENLLTFLFIVNYHAFEIEGRESQRSRGFRPEGSQRMILG